MMLSVEPILLIEGNASDKKNLTSALEATEVKCPLIHMNTSEEASIYLNNRKNIQPWLIFLGLNEQRLDGFNLLKAIKSNENLKQIPVIVFASSNEQCNVVRSFELGVAGYMVKSREISEMTDTIKTIMQYWTLSELPPAGG
jgi:PleD family two-component response regulator